MPNGQGFSISFEGLISLKPWTLRNGDVIEPNLRGEYRTKWCAANIVDPLHFIYLKLYSAYKEGYLLNEGGLSDQPAIVIEAINIIEGEVSRITERKRKEK